MLICFSLLVGHITMNTAPGTKPSLVEIKLDESWAGDMVTIYVPGNGDGKTWQLLPLRLTQPKVSMLFGYPSPAKATTF